MSTQETDSLCRAALGKGVKYLGVRSAHQLPSCKELEGCKRPVCFVVNTHTKDRPGEHWVAFWLPSKGQGDVPFLFDSFARTPAQMGHPDWKTWLDGVCNLYYDRPIQRKLSRPAIWKRQRTVVQDKSSDYCGVLCAFFLQHMCTGLPFNYKHVIPECALDAWLSSLQ